jgi:alcohol dehydrogenase class IV
MMDALCQGIESWWSVNSTEESYEYSRKTIELIMANWRKYIFDNDDEAAANIMLGANYSGRAINITATTAAHAMSYKITSLYKLPHGHAVAINLPVIWKYMLCHMEKCIDLRGKEYLAGIFQSVATSMDSQTPAEAISKFRGMLVDMDIQNPVSANHTSDISILASSVNPVRLKNNPIELDFQAIKELYETIVLRR